MANAHVLISSQSISSSTVGITFSSIPASYRDLIIVATVQTDTGTNPRLQFNGDTGNYAYVYMTGGGSTTGSGTNTDFQPIGDSNTSGQTIIITNIFDYSATDKHKSSISRSSLATGWASAWATRWASTSAINSIYYLSGISTNFVSGSKVSLYGVLA